MLFNYLPSANLQYFLTKLKEKFLTIKQAREYEVIPSKNLALLNDYNLLNGNTSGITWITNVDKSITGTGTCTGNLNIQLNANLHLPVGDYVISNGLSDDDTDNVFQFFAEAKNGNTYVKPLGVTKKNYNAIQFSVDYDGYDTIRLGLFFTSGVTYNKTIYPMICTLDEWNKSHTYEPYYVPVKDSMFKRSEQGVLGAKNLLKPTFLSKTINGVTFTVNSDGSISTSGTTNNYISPSIASILGVLDENETYILTGCPSGGSASTYRLYLGYNPGNKNLGNDYGSGVKFTPHVDGVAFTSFDVHLFAPPNVNMNGLVFKPMIRLASDPDDTYVPYAMTNRELTENAIMGKKVQGTVSGSSVTFTDSDLTSNSIIDGPYVGGMVMGIASVTPGTGTVTFNFTSSAANGQIAYIWIRSI